MSNKILPFLSHPVHGVLLKQPEWTQSLIRAAKPSERSSQCFILGYNGQLPYLPTHAQAASWRSFYFQSLPSARHTGDAQVPGIACRSFAERFKINLRGFVSIASQGFSKARLYSVTWSEYTFFQETIKLRERYFDESIRFP